MNRVAFLCYNRKRDKGTPMILVDANQIAISHLMIRNKIENGINIDSIRRSIIRVMGRIQRKFKGEFGQWCCVMTTRTTGVDRSFPYYKMNRKQERENSKYDWNQVFSVLNKIRDELRDNFPFHVLQVDGAEADDIIASLVKRNNNQNLPEPILILSADKDFIQLHKYPYCQTVRSYSEPVDSGFRPSEVSPRTHHSWR